MEIGSEFWFEKDYIIDPAEQFFLSGRTALDAIIRDAKQAFDIKRALLPSYCCDSMIIPFLRNKIQVRFYDVSLHCNILSVNIPKAQESEMLLIMDYFGAKNKDVTIESDFSEWIVVEDKTHSFFSDFNYNIKPDYEFVSFRKWFAVLGIAMALKRNGKLPISNICNYQFNVLRKEAFELKKRFINGEEVSKTIFLDRFKEAEALLDEDYVGYFPDYHDFYQLERNIKNKSEMINQRRLNATTLITGLSKIKELEVIVDFDLEKECPLFVPVTELTENRDNLKRYLIDNGVFCPVHWSDLSIKSQSFSKKESIFHSELSLICDQRYSTYDMEKILELINAFYS